MPNSVLGILGGGQLGSLLAISAKKLNIKTFVFSDDKNAPAKNFCDEFILGDYKDEKKIKYFSDCVDIVTIELENIPFETLNIINKIKPVLPKPDINRIVQNRFFEKDGTKTNEDYCQIINHGHFDRVKRYLDAAVEGGATIAFGGKTDRDSRFIEPTVLCNVSLDSEIMNEEIFGPLLPVLSYENFDEVVSFINERHRPLALYLFSSNRKNQNRLSNETSSGGFLVND